MPIKPKSAEAPRSSKNSIQSLIDRKKAERESGVARSAESKMAQTKEGVADILAGSEKPSDKISERKGESGEQGDITGGSGGASSSDDSQSVSFDLKDYDFPNEEVMISKIRNEIKSQIAEEWANARRFRKDLLTGGADGYSKAIARIRRLNEMMISLYSLTVGFLKNMYAKYFTPDGKRRKR